MGLAEAAEQGPVAAKDCRCHFLQTKPSALFFFLSEQPLHTPCSTGERRGADFLLLNETHGCDLTPCAIVGIVFNLASGSTVVETAQSGGGGGGA